MSSEKKNIIKIKRKALSSEQVEQKENFEGLVNKHRLATKRPAYKRKRFYFFIFLVLLIAYLIYQS